MGRSMGPRKTSEDQERSFYREKVEKNFRNLWDARDGSVQLLYKFQPVRPTADDCLKNNKIWLSCHSDLNDPFDCLVRLPRDIEDRDIEQFYEYVKVIAGEPVSFPADAADTLMRVSHSGELTSREAKPLEIFGLVLGPLLARSPNVGPLDTQKVQHHFSKVSLEKDWLRSALLLGLAMEHAILGEMGICSLSEVCDNHLLWAHYANAHQGFCVGYVGDSGKDNPILAHRVRYTDRIEPIKAIDVMDDPYSVFRDLILTKPAAWAYERERRCTIAMVHGLEHNMFPIDRIIFGLRMKKENKDRIRKALKDEEVSFFEVVATVDRGTTELVIEPARLS